MAFNRENQATLGAIGEHLVCCLLQGSLSTNKYDTKKDMLLSDGRAVEVKTQSRHPTNGCFTVNKAHQTNVTKCMTVDRLIFVEYDSSHDVRIWECTDRKNVIHYETHPTVYERYGRRMLGWPIKNMKLIHTITDTPIAAKMRSLSTSRVFNSDSPHALKNRIYTKY